MSSSNAKTVDEYLNSLDEKNKPIISKLRSLIKDNIPHGFVETINWGMICYEVPLETYPKTYNKKPLMNIALAAQKNYNSLYIMSVYSDEKILNSLKDGFKKAGLKLKMGKSCIRFKTLDDLPLDTIKDVISKVSLDDFITYYELSRLKN